MSSTMVSRRVSPVSDLAEPRPAFRWARVILAGMLLAAAVLLVLRMAAVSAVEAQIVALWLGPLLDGGVTAIRDFFVVKLPDAPIAFVITPECSAVVILSPLLVIAALMMLSRRIRIARGLGGLLLGLGVVVVTNQVRLATIAWASQSWGMEVGYDISHKLVGSVLGIIGFTLSVGVMFLYSVRTSRTRAPHAASTAPVAPTAA